MGRDKSSLTEQQTKQTVTNNNTDKKNIQSKQRNAQSNSHRLVPRGSQAVINFPPASSLTQHQA